VVVDWFRPHWKHQQCGGIVAGIGNEFKCDKCGETGPAISAIIPEDTFNHEEYFNSHPELEIRFCSAETPSARERVERVWNLWK